MGVRWTMLWLEYARNIETNLQVNDFFWKLLSLEYTILAFVDNSCQNPFVRGEPWPLFPTMELPPENDFYFTGIIAHALHDQTNVFLP